MNILSACMKVIVADGDRFYCDHLVEMVKESGENFEVLGVAYDGKQLLSLIRESIPDIVITNVYLPVLDGLEVIRMAREEDTTCHFIVISEQPNFEFAYKAIQYKVDGFFLKPVEKKRII